MSSFPPVKDGDGYAYRPGEERERLQLIWAVYNWCGMQGQGHSNYPINKNRELPIAWDLAHIFAAIAGGYVVELSPHYKGVQLVRKNKELWKKVSKFVTVMTGQG